MGSDSEEDSQEMYGWVMRPLEQELRYLRIGFLEYLTHMSLLAKQYIRVSVL